MAKINAYSVSGYIDSIDSRTKELPVISGPDADRISRRIHKYFKDGRIRGLRFQIHSLENLPINFLFAGLENEEDIETYGNFASLHHPFDQQIYFKEPVYATFIIYPKVKYILVEFKKDKKLQ